MAGIPNNICEIHSVGVNTRERLFGPRGVPVLNSVGIRLAGISEAAHGFSFCRLHPAEAQLLVTFEGKGEVWDGGAWRALEPGEGYLTPPGAFHAYRARRGAPWRVGWVIYDPKAPALAGLLPERPKVIPALAEQLRHSLEGAWDAVTRQLGPACIELWVRLVHASVLQSLETGHGVGSRLEPVWSAVHGDLARAWTLDQLARIAAMSKESLRRVCLKETGRSPLHQLARLRMRRAAELLLASEEKLDSVAGRVGYTDAFAFSAAFKREMGMPPSAYRKRGSAAARGMLK